MSTHFCMYIFHVTSQPHTQALCSTLPQAEWGAPSKEPGYEVAHFSLRNFTSIFQQFFMLPLVTEFSLSLLEFSRFLKILGGVTPPTPPLPPVAMPLYTGRKFSSEETLLFKRTYEVIMIEVQCLHLFHISLRSWDIRGGSRDKKGLGNEVWVIAVDRASQVPNFSIGLV